MRTVIISIIIFITISFQICIIQTGSGEYNLTITENDIRFYDQNMNEVNEISYGNTVRVVVMIYNTGNTTSELTQIRIDIFSTDKMGSDTTFLAVLKSEDIIIGSNSYKEITAIWDTDQIIGTSIYRATEGYYKIMVYYYPYDENEPETDNNSGFVLSRNTIHLKEKSSSEGIINTISIVMFVAILGFLLIFYSIYKIKNVGKSETTDTENEIITHSININPNESIIKSIKGVNSKHINNVRKNIPMTNNNYMIITNQRIVYIQGKGLSSKTFTIMGELPYNFIKYITITNGKYLDVHSQVEPNTFYRMYSSRIKKNGMNIKNIIEWTEPL